MRIHGGSAPSNTIDFSSPVNPLGTPKILIELLYDAIRNRHYGRYPDPEYRKLKHVIAAFYDIDEESIVVLNGAAEGLHMILSIHRPRNLIVFEPTFGDYRPLCLALGINIVSLPYIERGDRFYLPLELLETIPKEYRRKAIILISNPNNPTGTYVEPLEFEKLLEFIDEESIIIIDEAFIDFVDYGRSAIDLQNDRIVVLRSLTKIFAIPGLRLGFIYTYDRKLRRLLELARQPWNINSVTEYVVYKALNEYKDELRAFIDLSRRYVDIERSYMVSALRNLDLYVYTSRAPFILVRHDKLRHPEMMRRLLRYRVYVRDASSFNYLTPYHSRVAVKSRSENIVLIEAFTKVLGVEP